MKYWYWCHDNKRSRSGRLKMQKVRSLHIVEPHNSPQICSAAVVSTRLDNVLITPTIGFLSVLID